MTTKTDWKKVILDLFPDFKIKTEEVGSYEEEEYDDQDYYTSYKTKVEYTVSLAGEVFSETVVTEEGYIPGPDEYYLIENVKLRELVCKAAVSSEYSLSFIADETAFVENFVEQIAELVEDSIVEAVD
jgi:hypothetical protein